MAERLVEGEKGESPEGVASAVSFAAASGRPLPVIPVVVCLIFIIPSPTIKSQDLGGRRSRCPALSAGPRTSVRGSTVRG